MFWGKTRSSCTRRGSSPLPGLAHRDSIQLSYTSPGPDGGEFVRAWDRLRAAGSRAGNGGQTHERIGQVEYQTVSILLGWRG